MITTQLKLTLSSLALMVFCCSCKSDNPGGEIPPPKSPNNTIIYKNANLVYYGIENNIDISTHYRLSLYTDMQLDELNNPIGPGQILRLSINASLFESGTAKFPLPAGEYRSAKSGSDFTPGTFNYGFMSEIDLPSGKVMIPDGSFFGDIAKGERDFTADLLTDGSFQVVREGEDIYTISGMVVGTQCTKRKFTYTGKITIVDRSGSQETISNTTLTSDITLTNLTQARLTDRGDSFFLGDESCRTFELYLAAGTIDLKPQWPVGNGNLLKLEFFVDWTANIANGIPAGIYELAPQVSGGGIDRVNIIPGNIAPGYPDKFTYPSGTWYEKLTDGKMSEYARINGGTMTVARDGVKHTLTYNLTDCDTKTPHHVTGSYTQDTPIASYK